LIILFTLCIYALNYTICLYDADAYLSRPIFPSSRTDRSLRPLRTGVFGLSMLTRSLRPETQSLRPNSGWTSESSNSVICQGENPRAESPGSRAEVSTLEVATAVFRGDPLHHYHLREPPYKTTKP
jgi:hypothetical protein